jgi:hypothetical protein
MQLLVLLDAGGDLDLLSLQLARLFVVVVLRNPSTTQF